MAYRPTAREQARLAASNRLIRLLQEEASLLMEFPDLRVSTTPTRTTPIELRADYYRAPDGIVRRFTVC